MCGTLAGLGSRFVSDKVQGSHYVYHHNARYHHRFQFHRSSQLHVPTHNPSSIFSECRRLCRVDSRAPTPTA